MSHNNSSPSSTSSNDENYYSATEYISPLKGNAIEKDDNDNDANLSTSLKALNETAHEAMGFVNRCASFDPPNEEEEKAAASKNPWTNMETVADNLENFRSQVDQAWKNAKKAHDDKGQGGADQDNDDDDLDYESDDCKQNDELDTIDFSVPVNLDMEATIHVGAQGNDETANLEKNSSSKEEEKQDDERNDMPADEFRALYMDMMMETFGDDLEEIHQQGETEGAAAVDVNVLVECLESGIQFLDETHQPSFFESLGYDENGDKPMQESSSKEGWTVHQVEQRRLGYLLSNGE